MRLESLAPVPGPTGRIRLTFSDGSTWKVYPEVISDCGLCAGRELTDEELEALRAAAARASARQRAVRIVAASAVSERELERRLVRKGEDREQARDAVEWLRGLNAVDDRETARRIVRHAAERGYGRARARQELYGKGIPREYWDEALEDYPDMSGAIDRFLASRLRGGEDDPKQIKKVSDALCRRGFSWEEIRSGLRRYGAQEE